MELLDASGPLVSGESVPSEYGALSWFTPALGVLMGYGVAAVNIIQALMNRST